MDLYGPLCPMPYMLIGSQIYSRPIPISVSSIHSHLLPLMAHVSAFKVTLMVTYGVQITPRQLHTQKLSRDRFKKSSRKVVSNGSHLSHRTFSVLQLALFQS